MKYASSIRFGGQLVEAIACDYDDYKRLGLLCPVCKDPVYLRKDSVRETGDRAIQIPACFCHFPSTDPELAKACENRVAGYTQEDIDKARAIARNQRLKLLQRWFWSVYIRFHDSINEVPTADLVSLVLEGVAEGKNSKPVDFAVDIIDRTLDGEAGLLEHHVDDLLFRHVPEVADTSKLFYKKLSKLDLRFHKSICLEVFGFLHGKRQKSILHDITVHAIAEFVMDKIVNGDGSITWSNVTREHKELFAGYCLSRFIWLIAIIPWADEFEKLEDGKKAA